MTVEADRILMVETARRTLRRIDGVINNAGRAYRAPASETSLEEFRSLLEINLLAAFGLAQAAYEELAAPPRCSGRTARKSATSIPGLCTGG